jgi:magnesium transporter
LRPSFMIINYKKTTNSDAFAKIKSREAGIWVYVEDPTEENIKKLETDYELDPTLIKDALDPFEVPRMELEDSILYVFARIPHKWGERVITVPVLLALGADLIVSVSSKELPFLSKFKEESVAFNTTRKTKLFTQFLTEINHLYYHYLLDINKQVRKISTAPGKITDKDIAHFILFEEVLNTFLADLHPIETILKGLLTKKYIKISEDDGDLIEDIMLSTRQLIETCGLTLTNIVNIRSAYATIVTNNLNRVIKILTVLTIILTIPTIISSFYGMNIALPFEQNPYAFWLIMSSTIFISGSLLYIFKKKDWL